MARLIQKTGYIKGGAGGSKYLRYIATREGVEKNRDGEHGLFGPPLYVDLDAAQFFLKHQEGNVWTFIYSLRREDAERLGYNSAERWQHLLSQHQTDFANALGIPMKNLRWYAAYHDTDTHPHVHMMVWSDDPSYGYLTQEGVIALRSAMTNEIFKDEMYSLYEQKDISYKDLKAEAQKTMRELIHQMRNSICASPVIEQRMTELVMVLEKTKGKKQYGYLKKPAKEVVDAIVDELAQQPAVAQCYEVWNRVRDELEGYYKDKPREHLPLSQQKEFKVIKNMVIQEAENIRLGVHTFEDEKMEDEPEVEIPVMADYEPDRRSMWDVVYGSVDDSEEEQRPTLTKKLESLWLGGKPNVAHMLGKLYRDGRDVQQDFERAEYWFKVSAGEGNSDSEYMLGKMLLDYDRAKDGFEWLVRAANHGNTHAMYRVGKEFLSGEYLNKNPARAVQFWETAARKGNQYAQYNLGKLYLQGAEDVPPDKEEALRWLTLSAAQGNEYAQYFVEHINDEQSPSILLSATRLLHHMSRIFNTNSVIPANPQGLRIDSRRRRALQEKRIAMGHKPDDHEEYVPTQTWEQTM